MRSTHQAVVPCSRMGPANGHAVHKMHPTWLCPVPGGERSGPRTARNCAKTAPGARWGTVGTAAVGCVQRTKQPRRARGWAPPKVMRCIKCTLPGYCWGNSVRRVRLTHQTAGVTQSVGCVQRTRQPWRARGWAPPKVMRCIKCTLPGYCWGNSVRRVRLTHQTAGATQSVGCVQRTRQPWRARGWAPPTVMRCIKCTLPGYARYQVGNGRDHEQHEIARKPRNTQRHASHAVHKMHPTWLLLGQLSP
jgi:hypothetical protein